LDEEMMFGLRLVISSILSIKTHHRGGLNQEMTASFTSADKFRETQLRTDFECPAGDSPLMLH
jgi:hypothetical protein